LIVFGSVLIYGELEVNASSKTQSFVVAASSDPLATPVINATPNSILSGRSTTLVLEGTLGQLGGNAPYSCDWLRKQPGAKNYSVFATSFPCSGSPQSTGILTNPSGGGAATWHFMLQVTDSSPSPQTVNSQPVSVTVNSIVITSFIVSPSELDQSQTATVRIKVTWEASGSGAFAATLYSGTSSNCSLASRLEGPLSVTSGGDEYTFSISPSSSSPYVAFYCASVSEGPHIGWTLEGTQFTVNPPLRASISYNAPNIDSGQSIVLQASVVQGTGTGPYYYQWFWGKCAENVPTGPSLTGVSVQDEFSTGNLTTVRPMTLYVVNYSLVVTDSSTGHPLDTVCASAAVSVNPALELTVAPAHHEVDSGQPDILTATAVGGTPTKEASGTSSYSYKWYKVADCAGDAIPGAKLPTYTVVPTTKGLENSTYSAKVTDFPSGKSQSRCQSVTIGVYPAMKASLKLSIHATDSGLSPQVTAIVGWSGGKGPFSIRLTSGPSATSCSVDATLVWADPAPVPHSPVPHSFGAPAVSTGYCAQVTDDLAVPVIANVSQFAVYPALNASISAPVSIDVGQSVKLQATTDGTGTPPYNYSWFSGSACDSLLPKQNSSSLSTRPQTTESYSVLITDSARVVSPCAAATIDVTVGKFLSTLSLSPPAMDSGQNVMVKAIITWSGGIPPYSAILYGGGSSDCAFDAVVVGNETGINGTSIHLPVSTPFSTTYYCAAVTDSTAVTAAPYAVPLTVDSALVAPTVGANPGTVVAGHGSNLTTTSSFGGGTSPYSCVWQEENSGTNKFRNVTAPIPCIPGSMPFRLSGALPSGAWSFRLEVIDGAGANTTSPSTTVISGTLSQTTVTVECTPSSVIVGYPTNCRATVNGTASVIPGYVAWSDSLGAQTWSCKLRLEHSRNVGACSVRLAPGAAGSAAITAVYGGDNSSAPSGLTLSLVVMLRSSTTVVSCTPSTATAASSTIITCTATVRGYSPNGTVSWTQSGKGSVTFIAMTCALSNGKCSVELTALHPGSLVVTASYGGDTNNKGSSSPAGEGRLTIKPA